jgi:hypothetical protein
MKSRGGNAAAAEEYFPRGKPKGEHSMGGGKGTHTPNEKREARMVTLFGNKENKKLIDKKKKKIKKGKELVVCSCACFYYHYKGEYFNGAIMIVLVSRSVGDLIFWCRFGSDFFSSATPDD